MPREIDPAFTTLPARRLADAALSRARGLGAAHADFRLERVRTSRLFMRNAALAGVDDNEELGLAVRVVFDGMWGFAAGTELTADAAAEAAERAVELARACGPLGGEGVELAAEPVHREVSWTSDYELNPYDVPTEDKIALLAGWSRRLLAHRDVRHVAAKLLAVQENKFYADLAGTVTSQQRVRVHPMLTALAVDAATGSAETMRTLAPPTARGHEYLTGAGWDWDAELDRLPESLAEKARAPSVAPGTYDLVIHPSNLWLTIHESVGHATELDRVLGYERAFAGGTFATLDGLGSLRYGSAAMNVTGDRTAEHGLATVGFDDEGVAAQSWDLIRDGILVGYQLNRHTARRAGAARSNGCAFAGGPLHMPLQRMPNVSLRPAPGGPSTDELIAGVDDGIYIVGDGSWSIDLRRCNFQFTGQRFYRIRGGRLAGQLRDVAYQASTTEFWRSLEAVGGPRTYELRGADYCGKGQPLQAAAAGHGSPAALFRGVRILNTARQGGGGR